MGDPDGGRGRIYRLAPVGNKPAVPKLDSPPPAGLTQPLHHRIHQSQFSRARRAHAQGQSAALALQRMWHQNDPFPESARAVDPRRSRAGRNRRRAGSAARSRSRDSASWTARRQTERREHARAAKPLLHDASPQVRREIALMLRDPNPALMLPPYTYKDQSQPSSRVARLDDPARLAVRRQGSLVSRSDRDRGARQRGCTLRAAEIRTRHCRAHAFDQIVWELRPKTALPDLVATLNNTSASLGERTSGTGALGSMQWPEAARALESFIVSPDSTAAAGRSRLQSLQPSAVQHVDRREDESGTPGRHAKGVRDASTQSEAAAVAEALEDPAYIPDLLNLAKSGVGDSGIACRRRRRRSARSETPKYVADLQAIAQQGPARVRVSAISALRRATRTGIVGPGNRAERGAERSSRRSVAAAWRARCRG